MEQNNNFLNVMQGTSSVFEGVIFEVELKMPFHYGRVDRNFIYFISTTIQRVMYCLNTMGIHETNINCIRETSEIKQNLIEPRMPDMYHFSNRIRREEHSAKNLVFVDKEFLMQHNQMINFEIPDEQSGVFASPTIPLERYGIVEPVTQPNSTDARHVDVVRTTITSLDEDLF